MRLFILLCIFIALFVPSNPPIQVSIGISISFHWPLVRCKSCIILIVVQFYCCVNNLPSLPATNNTTFLAKAEAHFRNFQAPLAATTGAQMVHRMGV